MNDDLKGCLMLNSKGNFKREKRPKQEMDQIYNLFTSYQRKQFNDMYENYKSKFISKTLKIHR